MSHEAITDCSRALQGLHHTLWIFNNYLFIIHSHLVSVKATYISHPCPFKLWGPWFGVRFTHLICLPVPEEVDRAVHPSLDHSPATWVMSLVTPHLHKSVCILRFHQVHATGRVAIFYSLQTILPRTYMRVEEDADTKKKSDVKWETHEFLSPHSVLHNLLGVKKGQ